MKTPKRHIVSLIKITNYPEDMIAGNLFCNRLEYYREAELEEIGDKFEATAVSKQWYRLVDSDLLSCPVFCMYSVEARKQDEITTICLKDRRLKKFGHYAVVITDVKEFLKQIKTNLSDFSYEAVRYINMKNPEGVDKQSIFNPIATKDKSFKHQQEFRIYSRLWALASDADFKMPNVMYVDERNKKFPIGSLKDIARQFETSELFSGVNIELKIDWDYCSKDRFKINLPKLANYEKQD